MEFGLVNFAICAIVWFIAVTNAFVIHIIKEKVPDILWGITAIIWLGLLVFGLNLFPLGESLLTAFFIFFLWLILIFKNINMPGGVMKGLITGALYMGRFAVLNLFFWSVFLIVTLFFMMIFRVEDEKRDAVALLVISSFLTFFVMYWYIF